MFPEVIFNELRHYLPFLASTKLLVYAMQQGMGREDAHHLIKEHAVAAALQLREGEGDGSQMIDGLGADDRFPGTADDLWGMLDDPSSLLGTIDKQIGAFAAKVDALAGEYADTSYSGLEIL